MGSAQQVLAVMSTPATLMVHTTFQELKSCVEKKEKKEKNFQVKTEKKT
jgi:uncharacterized membrane protein YhiD involved in acid resistance